VLAAMAGLAATALIGDDGLIGSARANETK
jgi:hypothetical protein